MYPVSYLHSGGLNITSYRILSDAGIALWLVCLNLKANYHIMKSLVCTMYSCTTAMLRVIQPRA
jgi:hypothetical protein